MQVQCRCHPSSTLLEAQVHGCGRLASSCFLGKDCIDEYRVLREKSKTSKLRIDTMLESPAWQPKACTARRRLVSDRTVAVCTVQRSS